MKRSELKRKTPMKRSGTLKATRSLSPGSETSQGSPRRPINKVGPRTRAWRSAWRFLKPRLEAARRTQCEFDFIPHICGGPLDPAHSKKRNEMVGDDIYAVAIACRNIHCVLDEVYTHAAMKKAVMTAIERGGGMILP